MTHHAPKHVNEPSIWVISKSFTTASSKSSDHFVIQAQVQNSVHHSGHWNLHHNKQRPVLSLYQTTLECFGSSWKKLLHQCGMCPSFFPVRKSLYQRYNSHKTKKPTVQCTERNSSYCCTRADRDKKWLRWIPQAGSHILFQCSESLHDFFPKTFRQLIPILVVLMTCISGNGESWWHWEANACHLCKVCSLPSKLPQHVPIIFLLWLSLNANYEISRTSGPPSSVQSLTKQQALRDDGQTRTRDFISMFPSLRPFPKV